MKTFILQILLVLVVGASSAAAGSPEDARLQEFFRQDWERAMRENPTWASELGDRRWNDKWPTSDPSKLDSQLKDRLKQLDAFVVTLDRSALSPAEQLNLDLFSQQLQFARQEHDFRWDLIALNQRGGIQTQDELVDQLRFETVKDYEDWIARLDSFPVYLDETIALMRLGIEKDIVHPKIIMQRVPNQIDRQIVDDPTTSGFFKPFKKFPAGINDADQKRLSTAAERAIRERVVPAYRKFKHFFVEEYLPASLDEVGIWQLPNGDAVYKMFVRQYTTTNLTPQEVHELGLSEVARIRAEMQTVMKQAGFNGSLEEFFTFLRTDKRFFYETGDELLAATRALSKKIDPKLVKLFKTMPRMPYGVEPIPMNIAPDTTTAYYQQPAADGSRAGTYYVNLYRPETRPKWEMVALTLHEAVPGHHFQIARAMELGEIPEFRRYGGYTAFVEGWALYCERLGEELGLYDDPYDRFGRLTYEMWRAVRLVVDTGIHHKRWTRQQAIDYFKANAPKSELDITNEVDRYIAWPGQALAYKIGELKIRELRARAEKALGKTFDIKEFHDVLLGHGAVPLDVLEKNVNAWIETAAR